MKTEFFLVEAETETEQHFLAELTWKWNFCFRLMWNFCFKWFYMINLADPIHGLIKLNHLNNPRSTP
jgi:hypothetical protein